VIRREHRAEAAGARQARDAKRAGGSPAGPFEDVDRYRCAGTGGGGEAQALQACSGLSGEVSVMPAGVPLST
jgi:hypothetical protein